MPSPKKCSKFPKGSKAYNDCVNYRGPMSPKKSGAKKARKGY